jgi:hypothetical protein
MTAGDGSCSEASYAFTDLYPLNVPAYLNDSSGEFMAKCNGRKIAKGIVQHVDVCPAYAAERNFYFDVIATTNRFRNFSDPNIAFAGSIFH